MKKKLDAKMITLILLIVTAIGLIMRFYPTFADWWNSFHQSRAVAAYASAISNLDEHQYDEVFQAAEEYNMRLKESGVLWNMSEEQKADGNKDAAEACAENTTGCQLHGVCFGDAHGLNGCLIIDGSSKTVFAGKQAGDDNQSGHGENNEGVKEHTDHSDNALVVGLFNICHGMCMGCGTHTGFIGEQTALCTLADGSL